MRFCDKNNSDFPDWKFKFGNEIFQNISNKKHNSDLPILAVTQDYGAIPRDLIDFKITVTDKSVESYKIVEVGDFIISLRSFQGGIEYSEYKGICSPAYIILRPSISIDRIFFKYYLKTPKYITHLNRKLEGIRDGKMISYSYFSDIILPLPSIEEQNKVSAFLSLIDNRIQTQRKIIEDLKLLKKEITKRIFNQQIKFKNFNQEEFPSWEPTQLENILIKYEEKSIYSNQYPILTSARTGIYFQKDYFDDNEVASKNNTGYNVVPKGYFTYRHMSDDTIFRFNINNICDKGIVSTLYPVFTTTGVNDYFLKEYLNEGQEFKNYALLQKQGGSRTYMYFTKLNKLILYFPSIEEQNKIAKFLEIVDNKIGLETEVLTQFENQKKYLLQNLFV